MRLLFNKKSSKPNWDIADTVIRIEDEVKGVKPDNFRNYDDGTYICFRDCNNWCIYILESLCEEFKSNKEFYNNNMINITNIMKYEISSDYRYTVAAKAIPSLVILNHIIDCKYNGEMIYLSNSTQLKNTDILFKDLMNLQIMKDKYHI